MKYIMGTFLTACLLAFVAGYGLERYRNTIELTGALPLEHQGGAASDQLAQLKAFYSPQDKAPADFVLEQAVDATTEAAWMLCLDDQLDTMLAMWHRESAYKLDAHGAPYEDSKGITQTRMKDTPKWRAFWKARSVKLGPFSEVRTQAFFGVAEFREKLTQAKGDVKDAVRRYNGRGRKARKYADRVMVSRAVIFDRPYTKGERQPLDCAGEE